MLCIVTHLQSSSQPHIVAALFVLQQQNIPTYIQQSESLPTICTELIHILCSLSQPDILPHFQLASQVVVRLIQQNIVLIHDKCIELLRYFLNNRSAMSTDQMNIFLSLVSHLPISYASLNVDDALLCIEATQQIMTIIRSITLPFTLMWTIHLSYFLACSDCILSSSLLQTELVANRIHDVCRLWRLHVNLLSLDDCVTFASTPAEGHREGILLRPVSLVEKYDKFEYAQCLACFVTKVVSASKSNVSMTFFTVNLIEWSCLHWMEHVGSYCVGW
jgi:hypothetical protein